MNVQVVNLGEVITNENESIRGHGTFQKDGNLVSSVAGIVHRVNKLVSVKPLRSRYHPEVGDVVVGRITEVLRNNWKVDIGARHDAFLGLSAIILPGGVQRRRTSTDEMNMRNFYKEDELISAEIQKINYETFKISLHTRSFKYGKLSDGQFVTVPPMLIKRSKSHYLVLPNGVLLILGCNGFIWLSIPEESELKIKKISNWFISTTTELQELEDEINENSNKSIKDKNMDLETNNFDFYKKKEKMITKEQRLEICRVRNAVLALSNSFLPIYPTSIMLVCKKSIEENINPKEMIKQKNMIILTSEVKELIK
ncbi:exosome complex component rrp4 [Anaeramoeba flamelloides]|uniref:Exosome complex component rrp4 n=1 Tax=Anaeramoeba flamelloides TaxID=1746091 RepID=A0AAV7ZFP9_9EUKA|nr:exosome complex component rrp4 [Anaeramoeba flamelloides]KAJ6247970.1 exosome complex component rrp4 [Anaeramoeba flamelloides]